MSCEIDVLVHDAVTHVASIVYFLGRSTIKISERNNTNGLYEITMSDLDLVSALALGLWQGLGL